MDCKVSCSDDICGNTRHSRAIEHCNRVSAQFGDPMEIRTKIVHTRTLRHSIGSQYVWDEGCVNEGQLIRTYYNVMVRTACTFNRLIAHQCGRKVRIEHVNPLELHAISLTLLPERARAVIFSRGVVRDTLREDAMEKLCI